MNTKSKRESHTLNLKHPIAVGESGAYILYAESADLLAGEKNGPAQMYNTKTGEYSRVMVLQAWFKWVEWREPSGRGTPDDHEEE